VAFVGPTRYVAEDEPWEKAMIDGRCTCGWETAQYYVRDHEGDAINDVREHLELAMQGVDDFS
jgi:hypothetical protein